MERAIAPGLRSMLIWTTDGRTKSATASNASDRACAAFWLSLGRALPRRWRREVAHDSLMALRMGPAICLATWGAALASALASGGR